MLVEEKGDVLIRDLADSLSVNPHVRQICHDILGILEMESCGSESSRSRTSPSSQIES